MCSNAAQFLARAEKQGAIVPIMVGHRLMGISLLCTGNIAQGRAHFDHAIALYDAGKHRPLATRFGVDTGVSILCLSVVGSVAAWLSRRCPCGYQADAMKEAREINHAATLMYALHNTSLACIFCGNYETADAQLDEVVSLADEKGASYWKANGTLARGWMLALNGQSLGRSANAYLWNHRVSVNGINELWYRCIYPIWQKPIPSLTTSMTLGAALAKR